MRGSTHPSTATTADRVSLSFGLNYNSQYESVVERKYLMIGADHDVTPEDFGYARHVSHQTGAPVREGRVYKRSRHCS